MTDLDETVRYVVDANYISIDPDSTGIVMLHTTLREAATERGLNHSTIVKALANGDVCTCRSKTQGRIIIRRLRNTLVSQPGP